VAGTAQFSAHTGLVHSAKLAHFLPKHGALTAPVSLLPKLQAEYFYCAKINLPFCFESAHLIANLEDLAAQPPLPSASSPARWHPQTREPRVGFLFVYGGEGCGYG
jgi:hypothetical protein